MPLSPADAVRHWLVLQGVGVAASPGSKAAWQVFHGSEPDAPDSVLTLYDTEGQDWGRNQITRVTEGPKGVQVRVRSTDGYTGHAKCLQVKVLLEQAWLVTFAVGSDVYKVQSFTGIGDPIPLGKRSDNGNRYLFTLNFSVVFR